MEPKKEKKEFFDFVKDFGNTMLVIGLTCFLVWMTFMYPYVPLGVMFVGAVCLLFDKLWKKTKFFPGGNKEEEVEGPAEPELHIPKSIPQVEHLHKRIQS